MKPALVLGGYLVGIAVGMGSGIDILWDRYAFAVLLGAWCVWLGWSEQYEVTAYDRLPDTD